LWKSSTFVTRIERLHAINEELRRNAPRLVSASALAARFDVSRRTIERDLDALRLAGVPTYGQVGRRGGTALVAGGPSRPVSLTTAEIVSLVVAAQVADGSPYSVSAKTAIDKLLDTLDDAQRVAVEALRARFRLAPTRPGVRARVRSVVEDAVRTQTIVTISYTDREGNRTRRSVEPVGFYLDGDHWSLIGWCHLRQAGRMFHLDRVRRADATARPCDLRHPDEVLGWVPRPGRPA
jgi:predicted DNA-binding transcriptional regulator YafY